MKVISSIDIEQAPLGMMIYNRKDKKYYIAQMNQKGGKKWEQCKCSACEPHTKQCKCSECNNRQNGGGTDLPPGPEGHSWHHHHAPFYQVFNNYVCVKRDTLGEIRDFFLEMFSSKNYSQNKPPFSFDNNKN